MDATFVKVIPSIFLYFIVLNAKSEDIGGYGQQPLFFYLCCKKSKNAQHATQLSVVGNSFQIELLETL